MDTLQKYDLTDVKNAQEALEQCDCAWTAESDELVTMGGIGVDTHKALVRSDNNNIVGIVGTGYKPLQPSYSFSYFDSILQDNNFSWKEGLVLDGGSKIILKAQADYVDLIRVGDECVREIVLINSFNMSSSFISYARLERLVCTNGLTSSSKESKVSCRHTENAEFKANTELQVFSKSVKYFQKFIEQSKHLANVVADRKMVDNFLKDVFADSESTRIKNQKKEVKNLVNNGMGNGKGSAWDLYNGYTEWIDHARSKDEDRRLVSALLDDGARKKEKAFASVLAQAG